jgi:hypothetical protein
MALFTPQERSDSARRVCRLLENDARIEGAVLVGSMIGRPDQWSDIDIGVVVGADADVETVANGWVQKMYDAFPVLHHFDTAFGDTKVMGFLLESLLEIDIAFESVESFAVWGPASVQFDRSGRIGAAAAHPVTSDQPGPDGKAEAGFAWHDILHAHVAVRRNRLWQGLWYLGRVRNRTLALAQQRRGFYADFFDYADDLPAQELRPLEPTLVASLEAGPLLDAIEAATEAWLEQLAYVEPALSDRLERPLLELVRLRP